MLRLTGIWLLVIFFVGQSDREVHCPTYHGTRTNNGLDHYCLCSFRFCRNEIANIDSCENSVGHPVLYLIDSHGHMVNSSLQFPNYPCASLVNVPAPPMSAKCELFQLKQGCKGKRSCQGSARIYIRSGSSSMLSVSENTRTTIGDVMPTAKSDGDSTFGYCALGAQYNLVETLLIGIACLFAFAICCCGVVPLLCAIIKSMMRPHADDDHGYDTYRQRRPLTPPVTELSDDDPDIKCEHP